MFSFDWDQCRKGTQEVLLRASERFTSGENIMSINMPTRYGKTPTGRLLTGCSTKGWVTPDGFSIPPFASVNVWVTVNLMLRRQAASPKHWEETRRIFKYPEQLLYGEIEDGYDNILHLRPNNEDYLAINIHKIGLNTLLFQKWTESLINDPRGPKLPPIFHFDESHFYSEGKPWGEIVNELLAYGAYVCVWTATPRRSDGGIIPGYQSILRGESESVQSAVIDSATIDDKDFLIIEQRHVKTTDYILEAHVPIPFSEAWTKGYLCKISKRTIDVDLSEVDGVTDEEIRRLKLSQLTPSSLRKYGLIGQCARNPKAVREGVAVSYEAMMEYRRIAPQAAIIGFTLSDRDGSKNEHAQFVKKCFLAINPNLKIVIATQKVENAHNLIEEFVNNDYDVILFKGMGGVGWDCPRAMVCLDLSDDRQDASKIQSWMRVGTPHEDVKVGTVITLADQLANGIWNRCVQDEGGEATVNLVEVIGTILKEKEEKTRTMWLVEEAARGDSGDSNGISASSEDDPLARGLFNAFPDFLREMPDATMIDKAKRAGIRIDPPRTNGKSLDQQAKEFQDDIVKAIDGCIRKLYARMYGAYNKNTDNGRFGQLSQTLYGIIYTRAGIPYDTYVKVRSNRNIEQLAKLYREAQKLEIEVNRYEFVTS